MMLHDHRLRHLIEDATADLPREMARCAPAMAPEVEVWMRALPTHGGPVDYFLHPQAFPMLLLPWWLERSHGDVDIDLQADLVTSTISGYYYIRMIDDLMDGDAGASVDLLPALGFFHTRFQSAYHKWFPTDHAFWQTFDQVWCQSAEASMLDARLESFDAESFRQVAARKICAAKIPLAAVCHLRGWLDLLEPWQDLVDLLGCWHQMTNDVFDWYKDLSHGNRTYFLSRAESERQGEPVTAWVARDGFAWGCDLLEEWAAELRHRAGDLASDDLAAYLTERRRLYDRRKAQATNGLRALDTLTRALA